MRQLQRFVYSGRRRRRRDSQQHTTRRFRRFFVHHHILGNVSEFGFNPAPADRPVTTTFGADFAQFVFFDQPVSTGQAYLGAQFLTAAVPEPETYALMLAGLGAVGCMAWCRRTAKA